MKDVFDIHLVSSKRYYVAESDSTIQMLDVYDEVEDKGREMFEHPFNYPEMYAWEDDEWCFNHAKYFNESDYFDIVIGAFESLPSRYETWDEFHKVVNDAWKKIEDTIGDYCIERMIA